MKRKIKHWHVVVRVEQGPQGNALERILRASSAKSAEATARRDVKRLGHHVLGVTVTPVKVRKAAPQ